MVARHWWGKKNEKLEHGENLGGSESILCHIVMVGICHYTFVNINTKSDPNVNSELNKNVSMLFISYNKCTTIMENVNNRGT